MRNADDEQRGTMSLMLIAIKFFLSLFCILILYISYREVNTYFLFPFLILFMFYSPLIAYTFILLGRGTERKTI